MKLKKLIVNSGGGISPNAPVIIDFTKSNFVKATGDNGVGKSSLLEALLMGCGELGGKKQIEKFTNQDSGKIDIELSFSGNDRKNYEVKVSKSQFKLTYEGETASLGEEKTKLKELLGAVGQSPLEIKDKPVKEIMKWLVSYSTKNPEEFEKEMERIKKDIDEAVKGRATANGAAKGIREYLIAEGYLYDDGNPVEKKWQDAETSFKTKPESIDTLSARVDEANKKANKYSENQIKVNSQKERKAEIEKQIAALTLELDATNNNIKIGEDWLDKNKTAKKDYDDVREEYDNASKTHIAYAKWLEVKKKKKELDEYETAAALLDANEKDLIAERKQLQIDILPDIKGVEIVPEDTHVDGKTVKEGFYRDGLNSKQMSTTEWLETVMLIWRKNKVKIIVLDEYAALGSKAEEMLKKFEKDGCYIVVGEMSRSQKSLEIEYV